MQINSDNGTESKAIGAIRKLIKEEIISNLRITIEKNYMGWEGERIQVQLLYGTEVIDSAMVNIL